jgi:hypothetical protein
VLADLLGQAAVVGEEFRPGAGPRGAAADHVGVGLHRGTGVREDQIVGGPHRPEQMIGDRRPVGRLRIGGRCREWLQVAADLQPDLAAGLRRRHRRDLRAVAGPEELRRRTEVAEGRGEGDPRHRSTGGQVDAVQ